MRVIIKELGVVIAVPVAGTRVETNGELAVFVVNVQLVHLESIPF